MIFGLLRTRGDAGRDRAGAVHAAIVAAARRPDFYVGLAVPDTSPGRFELLVLHVALYIRRLRRENSADAQAFAQEVFDAMMRALDDNLREVGIGDGTVPKRVKTMARSFYDGAATYDRALDAGDEARLAADLARIVYAGVPNDAGGPTWLAAYAVMADAALAGQSIADLTGRGPQFPDVEETRT